MDIADGNHSANMDASWGEHPTDPTRAQLESFERDLVWVLGSPRTGSSWLRRLLAESAQITTINETYLGIHLVPIPEPDRPGEYFETGGRSTDPHYFFAAENVRELRPELRHLLLKGLFLQARRLTPSGEAHPVVIKEPNSSHASDTIISLLPRSRMIFLYRDGRDVLDSLFDALHGPETWWAPMTRMFSGHRMNDDLAPHQRLEFIETHGELWVSRIAAAQRAFDQLPTQQRLVVRYEDLLSDTMAELDRILRWLGVEEDSETLAATVAKHEFSNIPASDRGPGKEVRVASPGLWRQTFSEDEQVVMEQVMGEKLLELGYELETRPDGQSIRP